MQDLLVIDDSLIRKRVFSQIESSVEEMERLEMFIESFVGEDQRLFSQWFSSTFSALQDAINDKTAEHEELLRFSNNIFALSKMRRISHAAAMQILRQEELAYTTGTDADRVYIDALREEREEFLHSRSSGNRSRAREDVARPTLFSRSDAEEARFQFILRLSKDRISEICGTRYGAFQVLANVFNLIRNDEDSYLFLKVWDLTHCEHQQYFAKKYRQQTGGYLDPLIADIRLRWRKFGFEEEASRPQETTQPARPFSAGPKSNENIENVQVVKTLYRGLARRLHPDLQTDCAHQIYRWQRVVWARVQQAYAGQNRSELERLLRVVNIRSCNLNDVSLSEIEQYQNWIAKEVSRLKCEIKSFRRLPSWGFSRKRNRTSLEQRLQRRLTANLKRVEAQVEKLKLQLSALNAKSLNLATLQRRRRHLRLTYDGPEQLNFAF